MSQPMVLCWATVTSDQANSEIFRAYHYISTLGWTFFISFLKEKFLKMPEKIDLLSCWLVEFTRSARAHFLGSSSKLPRENCHGKEQPANDFDTFSISWQVFTSYPGCHGKEKLHPDRRSGNVIDQCKQEAKTAEKSALPNFGRQKGRIGSLWR